MRCFVSCGKLARCAGVNGRAVRASGLLQSTKTLALLAILAELSQGAHPVQVTSIQYDDAALRASLQASNTATLEKAASALRTVDPNVVVTLGRIVVSEDAASGELTVERSG